MLAAMLAALLSTIKELLDSKKFVAMFAAGLVSLVSSYCAKKGIVLDPDMAKEFVTIILGSAGTYAVSQAAADFGKEKVKEEAKNPGAVDTRVKVEVAPEVVAPKP